MIPIIDVKKAVKCRAVVLCAIAIVMSITLRTDAAWQLIWADEFTQADGTSPDSSKWGFDVGGGGWGNNQQEYDTARTNNARIEGGNLVIEARQENYMGRNYTSARMLTKGKWAWTYGRMEARIKLPRGQGIWPAFWTLGANIDGVGWPACGEIDIMENIGKASNNEQGKIYGTIHGPQGGGDYNGGAGVGSSYTLPGGAKYADDFHVFAIEWTTNQIKWFMDDLQYFTATPANLPGGSSWPFSQPQFILLNLAVGGNWPGYPDGTTVFPQQMLVDYVRVYAFSNAPVTPPTNSGVLQNGNFENGLLAPWVGKDFANANPSGGVITDTNGLVWNPVTGAVNNQGIKNPAFGMYACKVYGNYTGGPNSPGFFQDVDALPGSLWTASIKARSQNTDHIRDLIQSVVEVSFYDQTSSLLAKYASQVFTTNTPINTWITMAVTNRVFPAGGSTNLMRAPPGTVKLRFEVTFSQAVYDWGSIYYDEAQLQEVVVTRPLLNAFFDGEGNIEISFGTQSGVSYQVLFKDNGEDAEWTPLQTIVGDGTTKHISYPATTPVRFYSVQVL